MEEAIKKAKQKAIELGNLFYDGNVFEYDKKEHLHQIALAKKRAKICIQEIINSIQGGTTNEKWKFWHDVMFQLDNL